MHPFREVKVWEKSHQVGLHVYRATAGFPVSEQFGLTGQLRRVAVAVPSKIAEGCGRGNDKDLARSLETARGYAMDLEYQLILARDLEYLDAEEHAALSAELLEVHKMLAGFIKAVRLRIEEARTAAKAA
jgi:four helix bundle protein